MNDDGINFEMYGLVFGENIGSSWEFAGNYSSKEEAIEDIPRVKREVYDFSIIKIQQITRQTVFDSEKD